MTLLPLARPTTSGRLAAAAREFSAAWKRRDRVHATRTMRHLAGMATLLTLVAIAVSGAEFDVAGRAWAAGLPLGVVKVFAEITRLGDSGYVFALTVLVGLGAVLTRDRGRGPRIDAGLTQLAARAMFLFVVAAGSGIASQVLKHLFGRARPQLYDVVGPLHFDVFSFYAKYASFPSGHTVTAFAMALAIYYLAPRAGLPLFVVAVLVGVSRVAIGSHYVSDVLAGAALGLGSAMVARREFCARKIVFANCDAGVRLRGRGTIWRAIRR